MSNCHKELYELTKGGEIFKEDGYSKESIEIFNAVTSVFETCLYYNINSKK